MSWTTPLTALPHLSDEAVAAFADGVLTGQARQRAQSHMAGCGECSDAVYGQRSASAMLRSASAPSVPSGLLDRLRELPITADLPTVHFPSGLSADGQPMFAAFNAPLSPSGFHPAPLAPAWPGPPANPRLVSSGPPGGPVDRSAELTAHPTLPGHPRRRASSRAGLGAAAVAAVAIGMLASTAAAAGGVTTTGRPAAPTARPSNPFVESPAFGQTQTALLTFIPSPR